MKEESKQQSKPSPFGGAQRSPLCPLMLAQPAPPPTAGTFHLQLFPTPIPSSVFHAATALRGLSASSAHPASRSS